MIRAAQPADSAQLAAIYNHYIAQTVVTFEESPVSAQAMQDRVADSATEGLPWVVIEPHDQVMGYAYASKWKGRCAYRYTVEVTVYLAPEATGQGLGSRLYDALFGQLKAQGYHAAIAGISLPNEGSVALHEKFGMRKVAHFEEVGFKFGEWVDVGYWQCVFGASTGTGQSA